MRVRRAWLTGDRSVEDLIRQTTEEYMAGPLKRYVPFVADLIAEPPPGAPFMQLMDVLPDYARVAYGNPDN